MYSNLSKGIVNKVMEVFGIFMDFKYNKYIAFRETTTNI